MSNYLPLIVRNILVKTGWNENEIAVYSALLEKGAMSLTDLSQEVSLPISTLQYVIKKLLVKKVVAKTLVNDKPFYRISDISQLQKWIKGCLKEYENFDETINKFINQYDFNPEIYTPKVRFYEGVKGVKQSYKQVLNECPDKEIKAIFSVIEEVSPELQKFLKEDYLQQRVKKRIHSQNIALHSPTGLDYQKHDQQNLSETRLIKNEFFPKTNTEINLYDDCLHCMSFNKNTAFALIVKDESLSAVLQSIFKTLWHAAEKIRFFDGPEGVKNSYRHILNECKSKEICAFFSIVEEDQPDLQKFFNIEYVPNRVKKGIHIKNIAAKGPKSIQYKKDDKKELRSTLLVSKEYFPTLNSEINVYDSYIHCMSFDAKQAFAIIINDTNAAQILRGLFQIAWHALSNNKKT